MKVMYRLCVFVVDRHYFEFCSTVLWAVGDPPWSSLNTIQSVKMTRIDVDVCR